MDSVPPETGTEDGAERAFEALREEVVAQGKLLWRVASSLKAQQVAPDYSPTLGSMAKSLKAIADRLSAIEGKPGLTATAQDYRALIERAGQAAGKQASEEIRQAARAQNTAANELQGLIRSARDARQQRRRLIVTGLASAVAGILLWLMLIRVLPVESGARLALLSMNKANHVKSADTILHDADAVAWKRLVDLGLACAQQPTETCVAAIKSVSLPTKP